MTEKYQEIDPDQRRRFAQEQLQFLKDNGIKGRMRRSRIFKAAGPGQIQEAWKLATFEDWSTDTGKARRDLLDCILTGFGGSQQFGWERMKKVLSTAGFYVPTANSSRGFFRTLDGALEILVPNSYEFTDEEISGIEEGLKKKIESDTDSDDSSDNSSDDPPDDSDDSDDPSDNADDE